MSTARIFYRTRQFWQNLWPTPAAGDLEQIRSVLNSAQLALFSCLQPGEQAHSLHVLKKLVDQGHTQPDLLVAALLHDAGKIRFPLRTYERVLVVLFKAFSPGLAARWGFVDQMSVWAGRFWRRPFVVAEHHPAWGAELAAEAGASPLAVTLIRRHQERLKTVDCSPDVTARRSGDTGTMALQIEEDRLLRKLQAVDNES